MRCELYFANETLSYVVPSGNIIVFQMFLFSVIVFNFYSKIVARNVCRAKVQLESFGRIDRISKFSKLPKCRCTKICFHIYTFLTVIVSINARKQFWCQLRYVCFFQKESLFYFLPRNTVYNRYAQQPKTKNKKVSLLLNNAVTKIQPEVSGSPTLRC